MTPIADHHAIELLQKAKKRLVELAAEFGSRSEWEEAHEHLNGASRIDQLLSDAPSTNGAVSSVERRSHSFTKLPYFYIDGDKLVKVGKSRDGGTYEHRVTRQNYELIIDALKKYARSSEQFETQSLVDRCPIPKHEPGIVARVLEEEGLLVQVRRGTWQFEDRWSFDTKVQAVWQRVQRHRT